jgi:hypothetical protein
MKKGHMKGHSRFGLFLTLFATLALTVTASAARLTAVMVFSCDENGNPAGDFVWDTRGLDSDFYKIWLTRGTPDGTPNGLTGPFFNGPDWAQAPIDVTLEEGTNNFTMFFQYNGPWRGFALHLFFDDNTVAQISAKASSRTCDEIPEFTPNSARNTYSLTSYPAPNAPASGTMSVVLDRVVELAAYYVANTNVFDLDRVHTHAATANERVDFVGTFTLVTRPPRDPPTRDIKIDMHVTEITVCWESEADRLYQVQYRSRADGGEWTNLGEPVPGDGTRKCVPDKIPVDGGQRLYRVVHVP